MSFIFLPLPSPPHRVERAPGVHRIGTWRGPKECRESHCQNYKKVVKTNRSTRNYQGMSLLSAAYRTVSNSLPSKISPCADEIFEDSQSEFRRNRSISDQSFCIRQMVGKKIVVRRQTLRQLFGLQESLNFS